MSLDRPYWKEVRSTVQKLFAVESGLKDNQDKLSTYLYDVSNVDMHVPATIGDYTDFYSSRAHAFNVGSIIRGPENAINENWMQIPIGYHGRSSSIVVSGTDLRRPRGQTKAKDAKFPSFTECKRLDFEMEIGAFIGGTTNQLGKPIKVNDAWNNVFGFVLFNDWSYRDFQTWEYVPLGPFTAKNGQSTISPWIVTVDALEGSEIPLSVQDPEPLPYLREKNHISFDMNLCVAFKTPTMQAPDQIVKTNFKYLYWSVAQQLAHHSVSGCNMRAGDMLGSGTISGEKKEEWGSLLELTWGGRDEITLGNGEKRKFVEDGDEIIMTGFTMKNGKKIGFGDCAGKILPAHPETEYY